jgi:hypothetical protein
VTSPMYVCRCCWIPALPSRLLQVEGRPYCQRDYLGRFGIKCARCSEFISGEVMNALDKVSSRPHPLLCT